MLTLRAVELYDLDHLRPEGGHKSLEICSKRILELFPTSDGVFGKAFKPMPGWPFDLEG